MLPSLVTVWAWTALLALSCTVFGLFALERLLRIQGLPPSEALVSGAAVGVLAFALSMFGVGFLHAFGPVSALLLPAVMLAIGTRHALRRARGAWKEKRPAPRRGPVALLVLAFGTAGLALVIAGTLTPESINFDASWFHLALAADYARKGGIVPFAGDYMRSVPHLASLLYTWAFLVPGLEEQARWMLAQRIEVALFTGTLAGISAMTEWLLAREGAPKTRGTWAATFLFPAIFVYDSNLGGAADHALAFFAAPLFLAAVRGAESLDKRACALAGLLAGGALLTKYQALYLLAGVALVAGWTWGARAKQCLRAARRDGESGAMESPSWVRLFTGPALGAAVATAVVAPHFAMNWVFHKNPVYPLAQDVFRGSTPALPGGAFLVEHLWKVSSARPEGPLWQRIASSLRTVVTYSFETHYSFHGSFPVAGSLFTLGLPVLPFLRDARRVRLGALAGCAALFVWAFTLRIDRNLQTFQPLLVATTAAVIVRAWEMGAVARAVTALLVVYQVAVGAAFVSFAARDRIESSMLSIMGGGGARGATGGLDYRHDHRAVNEALPPGALVLMHDYRPSLGINRDVLFDLPGQQGLVHYDGVTGPRGLDAVWRALGVTHVVRRPGLRPAATRQLDVLVADYAARHARSRRSFGTLELLELPDEPPPAETPYLVLSLGLPGYADGLYPVETMSTVEQLDEELRHYAAPAEKLVGRSDGLVSMIHRASAALLGPGAFLGNAARGALTTELFIAMRYDSLTVLLRRRPR